MASLLKKYLVRYQLDLLWAAVFLLLPLALYYQVTLGGQTMIPADNLNQWAPWSANDAPLPHNGLISDLVLENYVWKQFLRDSLAQGEIPLWNPHLFAGAPFLATGQNAAYYPFGLLFYILPLWLAYGWFTFSQIWLAGLFTYLGGRLWGISRTGAGIAGLIFQGCGFMLVSAAVFPMIISAAVWMPLLLGCLHRIFKETTAATKGRLTPWIMIAGTALGMQILAGHIEITYYTLLVLGAYTVWKLTIAAWLFYQQKSDVLLRSLWQPASAALLVVLIGLMVGGIQFIPFYEVGSTNFREGSASFEEVRGWAFPPRRILTLLLPNFFGSPSHHEYTNILSGATNPFLIKPGGGYTNNPFGAGTSNWGIKNYVEGGIYLGIFPLILTLFGCWQWLKKKNQRAEIGFLIGSSMLSLSFIFGTPLYAILYYGLPGINQLHSPFRWIFPLSLFVAWLAGFGVDYLLAEKRPLPFQRLILFLAPIPLIATLLFRLLMRIDLFRVNDTIFEQFFLNLAQAPEAFHYKSIIFYSYLYPQMLQFGWILLACALLLTLRHKLKTKWWVTAVCLLITVDLFLATSHFHTATDPAPLAAEPESIAWLQAQPGHWRLTSFDTGSQPLHANTPWLFGLQDVRGYDSIIAKQYVQYMGMIEPQEELPFNRIQPIKHWESLNSPWLDLLGVKYIVAAVPLELPKLELAHQSDGLFIYENLAVVPRAYTIPASSTKWVSSHEEMSQFDPRQYTLFFTEDLPESDLLLDAEPSSLQPAVITASSNIELSLEAATDEPAWLILNDSYFPGWKLFARPLAEPDADETEWEIYRVNGNFRAASLPPGEWALRFRYSPTSFKLGGLTSFMGGIIILFSLFVWAWERYYDSTVELSNIRSIAKNSVVPMILNLFNRGIDFVFAAFYLRLLGPGDAGGYATAIAIAGWFEIIANFGLNTFLIREVSQDKEAAGRYLLNTSILRIGTTLLALIPIFIYLWQIPLNETIVQAIIYILIGMTLSGLGQGLAGLFYAHEEAEIPAAVATITTILKVGFGVGVLLFGYGFVGLAAVSILVNILTLCLLALITFTRYPLHGPWKVDFPLQLTFLRQSYPLMINHLFAVVFFQIDIPILQQYQGDEAVGWYNSAYKWINAFNVIPAFFTFALFPVISRQVINAVEDAHRTFRMALKLMALISLPLAVTITFTAPWLIGLLGGDAFLPHGAIALQIVVWSIPFGWLNSVTNYVLISLGQERLQTWAFLGGVTFNLVTNLLFIPRYGYIAAGITTILSEIVLLVIFNYYLIQKLPNIGWFKLMMRPTAVAVLMFLIMSGGWLIHPIIGLTAGLAAYPIGLWLFNVFGEDEKHILRSILPPAIVAYLPLGN